MDELATLTADLRAWLSWQEMLGAEVLPRESVPKMPAVEAAPPRRETRPQNNQVQPARRTPIASPGDADTRRAPKQIKPVETPPVQSSQPRRASLSDKWKVLMESPTTHQVVGPTDAQLTIVRGSGSSDAAESMLDRMLENVLGLTRSDVRLIDLVRDTRSPSEIGQGLRSALKELKPGVVLVMGTFAVRALYGSEQVVADARGGWTELDYEGGTATLRVTHHPEAILALAARGQSAPKREAFDDLKAVADRLTSA